MCERGLVGGCWFGRGGLRVGRAMRGRHVTFPGRPVRLGGIAASSRKPQASSIWSKGLLPHLIFPTHFISIRPPPKKAALPFWLAG